MAGFSKWTKGILAFESELQMETFNVVTLEKKSVLVIRLTTFFQSTTNPIKWPKLIMNLFNWIFHVKPRSGVFYFFFSLFFFSSEGIFALMCNQSSKKCKDEKSQLCINCKKKIYSKCIDWQIWWTHILCTIEHENKCRKWDTSTKNMNSFSIGWYNRGKQMVLKKTPTHGGISIQLR